MDENGDFTQNEDWMGFIAAFFSFTGWEWIGWRHKDTD
jgi:hypothetical protein